MAPVNAAVALFAGTYLLIVMWQGNLGALVTQARADLIGGGFWRWGLALIVLVFISQLGPLRPYSGALIGIVLVAMLIEMETTQPGTFQKLNQSIAALFGRSTATGITGK